MSQYYYKWIYDYLLNETELQIVLKCNMHWHQWSSAWAYEELNTTMDIFR